MSVMLLLRITFAGDDDGDGDGEARIFATRYQQQWKDGTQNRQSPQDRARTQRDLPQQPSLMLQSESFLGESFQWNGPDKIPSESVFVVWCNQWVMKNAPVAMQDARDVNFAF